MKKKSEIIVEIVKILLNCAMVPLFFIKIFRETAALPGHNENGGLTIHRINYYYSIFNKLAREGIVFLMWFTIAIIILSMTLSVLNMTIMDSEKFTVASHLVFGLSIILFFIILLIACSIYYVY